MTKFSKIDNFGKCRDKVIQKLKISKNVFTKFSKKKELRKLYRQIHKKSQKYEKYSGKSFRKPKS